MEEQGHQTQDSLLKSFSMDTLWCLLRGWTVVIAAYVFALSVVLEEGEALSQ